MTKDAFYFPHFSNARHDRKIKRVIKELGVEGYGCYFMLLEVLREQSNLKYPIADIDLLADEFRTSEAKLKTVIGNYDLFEIDQEEMFFSPKMFEYLEPYFKMKEQRRLAGLKSGEKRKQKMIPSTTDERPFNDCSTTDEQSKVKESKVKEKKESKVKEREKVFYKAVGQFTHTYSKKMLREFFDYWTEQNKSGTHMRYELEKTWDLSKRLARWAKTEKADPASTENHIPASMKKIKKLDQ